MEVKRTYSNSAVDHYEIRDGSHLIRITDDKEHGHVTASAWVNNGETICRSKTFKTLGGAQRWGRNWLTDF